jgi:hypothetical protein
MKRLPIVTVVCVIVFSIFAAWRLGRRASSDLVLAVRRTPIGVQLDCVSGCNWKRLAFGCPEPGSCEAEVSRHGLGPVLTLAEAQH